MTLKEIGEQIGLTRERVRQIEHEALGKLRDAMTGRKREVSRNSRCRVMTRTEETQAKAPRLSSHSDVVRLQSRAP